MIREKAQLQPTMAGPPVPPQPRPQAKRFSSAAGYLVWGSLAVCAVVAVAVLMALGIGATRGGFGAMQTTSIRPPAQPIVQKPQVSEFEIARLNDALRALSAERDRLAARVDQLERSVGDITASINTVKDRPAPAPANAQPAAAPASPAPPLAAAEPGEEPLASPMPQAPAGAIPQTARPASVQAPAPAQAATELEPAKPAIPHAARPIQSIQPVRPAPAPKAAKTTPPPAAPASPPQTAAKGPPTQVAQILSPAAAANAPTADSGTSKTEFAIDLGGEMSIDGLRARWANIKGNHGVTLEGMRPLVSVREGVKPGTVELRLIAGPLANAGDAARVCASLQTKGVACRTTDFDGQRLSLR